MSDYFTSFATKSAISSGKPLPVIEGNPEVLLEHYRSIRRRKLTPNLVHGINELFIKWCELLFCGFNIVVRGPQSKFALLETFATNYLESGKIPDYSQSTNGELSFLKIQLVVLNGLQHVATESFYHAVLNIKDKRKVTDRDHKTFISETRKSKKHIVFMIHSYETLFRESKDIYHIIFRLYFMCPKRIHIILSSDCFYGVKKLGNIKFSARLLTFTSPYWESFFEENLDVIEQIAIETGKDSTQMHMLFDRVAGLQSLKETYRALGNASKVMTLVIKDFVKKSEMATKADNSDEPIESKRLRSSSRDTGDRRKTRSKTIETHLDFHDFFNQLQSKFIVRRTGILRQQLDELKDHNIIEYDESGNKIQCIVRLSVCKRFLEYVNDELSEYI